MANQRELLEQQQLDAQSARAQNFTIYCKAAITPPFDDNGTKLGKFFDNLEMCGKAASASLDMLLEVMPVVMMPETRKLFLLIPEEERDTYYNAKSALQRKLEPTWARDVYLQEFEDRKQRENETVAQFVAALMSLARKAMIQLEGEPEDYYLDRVNDAVRARLLRNANTKVSNCIRVNGLPDTLEECIIKAKNAEILDLSGSSGTTTGRIYPMNSQKPTVNRNQCYNCNKIGHFAKDCRAPKNNNNADQQTGEQSNSY